MKIRRLLAVCVLLLCANIQASEVKLSNQKKLFSADEIVDKNIQLEPVWAARLNPAGTHIIYPVSIKAETEDQKTRYDLEVFDLSDSSKNRIGVSLSRGYKTVFTRFNCFDPSGLKLLVFRDKPQDSDSPDGVNGPDLTEVVIYDLTEKRLIPTRLSGQNEMGRFDHTGDWIYQLSGGLKLSLADSESQHLSLPGWIHSPSMFSVYTTVFVQLRLPPKEGERRSRHASSLQIWNMTTNTKVTELPVHPDNAKLDDIESEWTSDGRYVYYTDIKGERCDRTLIARVWDVEANKEKTVIDNALSVGPGPGKSTMVMVRIEDNKIGEMFLHCTDGNREIPFGTPDMRLVHAWSDKIIYTRPENGIEVVYTADMELVNNKNEKD